LNPKNFTREQAIEIWESQDWCCADCGIGGYDEMNIGEVHHIVPKSQMTKEHMENGRVKTSLGRGLCRRCHSLAHGINIAD